MEQTTQEKLLTAGKAEFLEKGFEGASLRSIAAKAGVTTGAIYGYYPDKSALFQALVEQPAAQLRSDFLSVQDSFHNMPAKRKETEMHSYSSEALQSFINKVYDNYDAFKLIVCCSAGTEYENFIESLVDIETTYTWHFIDDMNMLGHCIRPITKEMAHILSSAYFFGIFETIAHDMSREKALEYIQTLSKFYSAGWDKILG